MTPRLPLFVCLLAFAGSLVPASVVQAQSASPSAAGGSNKAVIATDVQCALPCIATSELQDGAVTPVKLQITNRRFSAVIQPGQTQVWFTFGFQDDYVVSWFVVPTSYGRLTSEVAVERQGETLIYFITVRNLMNVATTFEARYAEMK